MTGAGGAGHDGAASCRRRAGRRGVSTCRQRTRRRGATTCWQRTRRASLLVLAAALALLLPTCASRGGGTVVLERVPAYSAFGLVWGRTVEEAVDAALLVNEAGASVVRHLPGARLRPVDVVLVDAALLDSGAVGSTAASVRKTSGGRITMRLPTVVGEDARRTLVHEMVHVMVDDLWDDLPQAIEEALADRVAAEDARERGLPGDHEWPRAVLQQQPEGLALELLADGESVAAWGARTRFRLDLADPLDNLLRAERSLRAPTELNAAARATAFLALQRLADRDGLAGLRALFLSLRGRSREFIARTFLERAGLHDGCDLAAAAHQLLDPDLAVVIARELAALQVLEDVAPGLSPDAALVLVVDGRFPVAVERDWFAAPGTLEEPGAAVWRTDR